MFCRISTLVLAAACLTHFASPASADDIVNNATVTILPSSSTAYSASYPQSDALDIGPNQYVTDYASAGQGANTHLDFKFPVAETFSQIQYTDRTTSGGSNGAFVGGTGDFNKSYEFVFSTNAAFTNIVGTVVENHAVPSGTLTVASFQQTDPISDITAQFVRFQVLNTGNNSNGNPGAANFQFSTVPEPSSLILCGLGAAGLLIAARRRRRA